VCYNKGREEKRKEGVEVMQYKINDQYKDRLFCFLFGNEKYKKYALSLYNAINGVHYENEDELEIMTLKDVIYIRMKNDVAVMLSGNLELWEHQSTVNPNMPLRGLMYFARLYEKYLAEQKYNRYQSSQIIIPTPNYVVFYNGEVERPAVEDLHLSDAFMNEDTSGRYEWTARVFSLNHPENEALLRSCEMLQEYTNFVTLVRKLGKTMEREDAVDEAVKGWVKKGGELAEILSEHRAEVVDMLLTEFDEEAFVSAMREEGRQEGIKEGRQEGIKKGLVSLITTLREYVSSTQELCQKIISTDAYKDFTYEEIQSIIESLD